jgi:hypothetical protein
VVKFKASALIFLCGFCSQALAALTATVNHNPVRAGQPVVLTIESDGDYQRSDLDTSNLDPRIQLGHMSFSKSTQNFNGRIQRRSTWTTVFYIDDPQTINIGTFTVGNEVSANFALKVLPEQVTTQGIERPDVFIENSLNSDTAYLGQVLQYQVKLFLNQRLHNGQLQAPTANGLTFTPIGDDQEATQVLDGKRYRVIQREYTVHLNQTGTFELPPVLFQGEVLQSSSTQSNFFGLNMQQSRPVRARGQTLSLTVLPPRDDFKGAWLVADDLKLVETWSDLTNLEVGTPITRTLALTAINSDVDLLPQLSMQLPDALAVYPEKPIKNQRSDQQNIIATMQVRYAIVPREGGDFTIPELQVPWWDPRQQTMHTITLPAKTLHIQGLPSSQRLTEPSEQANVDTPAPQATGEPFYQQPWMWLATLFALLWVGTIAVFFKMRKPKTTRAPTPKQQVNRARDAFEAACQTQRPEQVLKQLPIWFSEQRSEAFALTDIMHQYPALKEDITSLQQAIYSPTNTPTFDCLVFYQTCIKTVQAQTACHMPKLAELHPN